MFEHKYHTYISPLYKKHYTTLKSLSLNEYLPRMSPPIPAPESARIGVRARGDDADHVADALGGRDDAFNFPTDVDFGHVAVVSLR